MQTSSRDLRERVVAARQDGQSAQEMTYSETCAYPQFCSTHRR